MEALMAKKTINDVDLKNKKVLMRCDFNVPLDENGNITDDRRITASLPSIKKVLSEGGALILCSHLGRPKGEKKPEMSLKPVAKRLSDLLSLDVKLADDCIGTQAAELKNNLQPGEVLLLENLRFHEGETKNNPEFAKALAEGCELFVNDAFGTAHRAHASTEGVTHYIDQSVAGYLIEKEIEYLDGAINNPKRPLVAILGGAKISGKIDVIKNLFDKVDALIIGGGMVFTFFKARGMEIGTSLLEEDRIDMAGELLEEAEKRGISMLLPDDVVIADAFDNNAAHKTVLVGEIPSDWMGLDIGPKTVEKYNSEIKKSDTIVWNGPMGAFEMENFSVGTQKVAEALAETTESGATTIVGGGDSAAAISKFGLENKISHISTGGGASLEFLEGKKLPGIEALTDK
jgi:phosphoglycerate kinase